MVGEGSLASEKAEKWCGMDSSLKTAFSGQQHTEPFTTAALSEDDDDDDDAVEEEEADEVDEVRDEGDVSSGDATGGCFAPAPLVATMLLPFLPLNLQVCLGEELWRPPPSRLDGEEAWRCRKESNLVEATANILCGNFRRNPRRMRMGAESTLSLFQFRLTAAFASKNETHRMSVGGSSHRRPSRRIFSSLVSLLGPFLLLVLLVLLSQPGDGRGGDDLVVGRLQVAQVEAPELPLAVHGGDALEGGDPSHGGHVVVLVVLEELQAGALDDVPEPDGAPGGAEGVGERELDAGDGAGVARQGAQGLLRRGRGRRRGGPIRRKHWC